MLEGLNSRFKLIVEKITGVDDKPVEIIQSEEQRRETENDRERERERERERQRERERERKPCHHKDNGILRMRRVTYRVKRDI